MENGADLNAWRKRMGYTIAEAAEALGLKKASLIDNLYDASRPPSLRTIRAARTLEALKQEKEAR